MRARLGLAIGLTFVSSTVLAFAAGPDSDEAAAGARSAMVLAPRVPGATIAGPTNPEVGPEPLTIGRDTQAQGYGRRDFREDAQPNDEEDDDHGHGGRMGRRVGGMMGGGMGMPNRRPAFFFLRSGDSSIMVRCGPDESTKTCLDAMMPLLDKLQTMTPPSARAPATAPPPPPATSR